ncbi:MAG: RNA polymerase sigma factor (sigma-70 family) [Saprospiraceae bacterium]
MKKYSDIEIVDEIKKGNSDKVLLFLYQTTQFKLGSWIMKNNGNEDEAQDIFQDAVLSFYQYVLSEKFEVGKSVDAFIFSIGRNMWINRAKQKNKMVRGVEEETFSDHQNDEQGNEFSHLFSEDKSAKMDALLTQLGERCKELLTYSIFYNMKMVDIAEKMTFSNADTAKTKNYKCKKRLMKIINEDELVKGWLYQ